MNVIFRINKVIFLSIFILLSSCKIIDVDEEKNYLINLSSVGGITSYKGIQYTGKMVKYVDDEKTQLKWEKTYKEGKLKGLSEEYNRDGQLEYRGTYKDGKEDGQIERFYENGKLEYRGTYKDGNEDGQIERFSENGQLESRGTYKDGKEDGQWEYYFDGQLESRGTYKDGKEDGQWELYDENGKFVEKVRFIDGVKQDD